jgi:hypothetical protein
MIKPLFIRKTLQFITKSEETRQSKIRNPTVPEIYDIDENTTSYEEYEKEEEKERRIRRIRSNFSNL